MKWTFRKYRITTTWIFRKCVISMDNFQTLGFWKLWSFNGNIGWENYENEM